MLKEAKIILFFIIPMIIMSLSLITLAGAGQSEEMTVEANILSNIIPDVISIQVPDYIFLGNVTKGQMSNETKVTLNNTGNVNVIVTSELKDSSEKIFNYTQFRSRKADDFSRIEDFSFKINKSDNEYFYISLDLTNYPEDIPQDIIGHRANIVFTAMKQ